MNLTLDNIKTAISNSSQRNSHILYFKFDKNNQIVDIQTVEKGNFITQRIREFIKNCQGFKRLRGKPDHVAAQIVFVVTARFDELRNDENAKYLLARDVGRLFDRLFAKDFDKAIPYKNTINRLRGFVEGQRINIEGSPTALTNQIKNDYFPSHPAPIPQPQSQPQPVVLRADETADLLEFEQQARLQTENRKPIQVANENFFQTPAIASNPIENPVQPVVPAQPARIPENRLVLNIMPDYIPKNGAPAIQAPRDAADSYFNRGRIEPSIEKVVKNSDGTVTFTTIHEIQ